MLGRERFNAIPRTSSVAPRRDDVTEGLRPSDRMFGRWELRGTREVSLTGDTPTQTGSRRRNVHRRRTDARRRSSTGASRTRRLPCSYARRRSRVGFAVVSHVRPATLSDASASWSRRRLRARPCLRLRDDPAGEPAGPQRRGSHRPWMCSATHGFEVVPASPPVAGQVHRHEGRFQCASRSWKRFPKPGGGVGGSPIVGALLAASVARMSNDDAPAFARGGFAERIATRARAARRQGCVVEERDERAARPCLRPETTPRRRRVRPIRPLRTTPRRPLRVAARSRGRRDNRAPR